MNARLLLGIAGGCAAGFLAGWTLHPPADDGTSAQKIANLEVDLKSRTTELKSRTAELDRITVSSKKEEADKLAGRTERRRGPRGENPEVNDQVQKMQDRMKKKMAEKQKLKLDEKVAALRTRLNLTDSQAAAIRELLEKNPEGMESMIARAMSGEKMDEKAAMTEMLKPSQKSADLANKISALLTPEQQQAYTAFRQEQRSNDVEVRANKELARLQASLTLSPEQKDKAFTTLTKIADEEYDNPVNNMAAMMQQQMKHMPKDGPDMKEHVAEINAAAEFAAERRKMRVDAMREVLTPEQLAIYETQQKQPNMADMMDSAFGEMGANMFMGGDEEEEASPGGTGAKPTAPPRPVR